MRTGGGSRQHTARGPSGGRLRVLHVVLTDGGNRLLNALMDATPATDVEWCVVALGPAGAMAEDAASRGAEHAALGLPTGIWSLPLAVLRLQQLLRSWQPDVVHAHLFLPGLACATLRLLGGRPRLVLSRHHNRTHHTRHRPLHAWLDGWMARRADVVIAVSAAVKQTLVDLERVPERRVRVVHNGIDPAVLEVDPAATEDWRRRLEAPLLAVAAGRIDPEKDYDTLLSAVGHARVRFPELRLAVAGTGPDDRMAALRRHAVESGAGDVAFVGWVPDVLALVSAADIFVQASEDEACPMSILEAQALGVPLAVTTPGGVREVIAAEHPSIPPGATDALGARICAVLAAPDARSRAAARGGAVRSTYSASAMSRGHVGVYRELVGPAA